MSKRFDVLTGKFVEPRARAVPTPNGPTRYIVEIAENTEEIQALQAKLTEFCAEITKCVSTMQTAITDCIEQMQQANAAALAPIAQTLAEIKARPDPESEDYGPAIQTLCENVAALAVAVRESAEASSKRFDVLERAITALAKPMPIPKFPTYEADFTRGADGKVKVARLRPKEK